MNTEKYMIKFTYRRPHRNVESPCQIPISNNNKEFIKKELKDRKNLLGDITITNVWLETIKVESLGGILEE